MDDEKPSSRTAASMVRRIELQALAKALDGVINGDVEESEQKTGWCLLVFGFNCPGISNYVSNATRSDMIEALRETADRLENREDNVRYD